MHKSVLFSCRRRLHYSNSQTLHTAMNSVWIRHGAVDTWATTCSSALLSMELGSVPTSLFRKVLNIYSILSTSLYNSTHLLWWSFAVQIWVYSFLRLFFEALILHLHHQATSALPTPWQCSQPSPNYLILSHNPLWPLSWLAHWKLQFAVIRQSTGLNRIQLQTQLLWQDEGTRKMLLIKIQNASSELAQGPSQMQKQESPADNLASS